MAIDKQEAFIAEAGDAVSGDSIVNAKGNEEITPPNKDKEFMERYQIEDNIMYTIFSAPSRYMKIIILTYMMYGGVPLKQKAHTLIAYIVLGAALILLKSNAGTYSSLLSVLVALGLSMLMFLVIGVNDVDDVDDDDVADEDYIGVDIPSNEKENEDEQIN